MVKVYIHGQMAASTMDNMKMIKSMVKELSYGLMEENIAEDGRMGNNMARPFSLQLMGILKRASGTMERDCVGWTSLKNQIIIHQ